MNRFAPLVLLALSACATERPAGFAASLPAPPPVEQGEFLGRQFAPLTVGQHMFERRRGHIRRRLRGAGEPLGVVLLVGVDDAAESLAICHGWGLGGE